MSVASRPVSTGKTRTCPHCKATILESLSICPGCMHHLRFDSEAAKRQVAAAPALRVEGMIRHPPLEQPLEYFVIIAIRNDRGEEVTRQVVNVGALQAAEKRTFTLSVEVLPPQAPPAPSKSTSSTGSYKAPISQPTATVRPSTPEASTTSGSAGAASSGSGQPGQTKPPSGGAVGQSRTSGQGSTAAQGRPSTQGQPGSSGQGGTNAPGQPGTPAQGSSGYVLKPPTPGGPKRH